MVAEPRQRDVAPVVRAVNKLLYSVVRLNMPFVFACNKQCVRRSIGVLEERRVVEVRDVAEPRRRPLWSRRDTTSAVIPNNSERQ